MSPVMLDLWDILFILRALTVHWVLFRAEQMSVALEINAHLVFSGKIKTMCTLILSLLITSLVMLSPVQCME